jgi:hypothetical protein
MRERVIERHLVRSIKAIGGEVRKVQWIGRNSAPDRVVMVPARTLSPNSIDCAWCNPKGRTVWVELKAPGQKPTAAQLREHARMRAVGQDVRVIDSFTGVDALMQELTA